MINNKQIYIKHKYTGVRTRNYYIVYEMTGITVNMLDTLHVDARINIL